MSAPFRILDPDDAAPVGGDWLSSWRFGTHAANPPDGTVKLPLPVLAGASGLRWQSPAPVRRRRLGDMVCADNGQVLMAALALPPPDDGDWRRLTRETYAHLARFQARSGYPALLKVWNYLPGITQGEGDTERYRQFALGRFEGWGRRPGAEHALPAATAIGCDRGGLRLIWLAAKQPGLQIENPRQVSAFRYPRDYGPVAPSFSRATLKRWPGEVHLYVSGTASIVGHRSLHAGDSAAQMDEILRNLAALAAEAERRAGLATALRAVSLTAYVRDARDAGMVEARLRAAYGGSATLGVLAGEVCRRELRVEVEGVFAAPATLG